MALTMASFVVGCVFLAVCVASPTRRQFVPETTSFGPVVTSEGEVWDDSDEFDLDGDDDWLGESAAASSSSLPLRPEYEDYDDGDVSSKRADDDEDDVEVQDAEEDEDEEEASQDRRNSAEFLFLPSTDRRLMLQDDDADQSGLIKVRHTGKNSYSEVESNSLEEGTPKDDDQFEFTIGDDDDEEKDEDLEKDDFVLEDTRSKDSSDSLGEIPRPVTRDDEDDNDEGDDDEDDSVFENPEEDSQVIYGDHVFLY